MKKITLLLLFSATTLLCRAQVPGWLWAEGDGGTSFYGFSSGLSVDTITNYVFAAGRCGGNNNLGGLSMTSGGAQNPFVGKFNENGAAQWLSEYTFSTGFDYPYGFCRDKNDNTYLDGTVNSSQSVFIEKYNSAGVQQWQIVPGVNNFSAHGIAVDGRGDIYIAGWITYGSLTLGSTTLNYPGSQGAIIVAKLDPAGNFLWSKIFYGSGGNDGYCTARGMTIDAHANIYVAGGYSGAPVFGSITAPFNSGISSLFILKMDSTGKVLNLTTSVGGGYPSTDCCGSAPMTIDSCDDIYMGGYFDGTAQFGDFVLNSYGAQDAYVAKCDRDGRWDWAQDFGGTGDDAIGAITLDKNTDVYAGFNFQNGAAQIEGTNISGNIDLAVVKMDNGLGYVDWVQTAGSTNGSDSYGGIGVDNNGYIYLIGAVGNAPGTFGATTVNNNGVQGVDFLAKLDKLDAANSISITPNPDTVYCAGQTDTLHYTVTGTFYSGNIFTAQLSNSTGSFVNPVNIGSYISTKGGTITITIPPSTPYGTHYHIRILSTKPTLNTTIPTSSCVTRHVDTVAYIDITVYPIPTLIITGNTNVCPGDTTTLTTSSAQHYLWNTGDTTSSINVAPTVPTKYSVALTNGPCTWYDTAAVNIIALPVITVVPAAPIICSGNGVSLDARGAVTYHWSPAAGLNAKTGDPVFAGPSVATTYTVTGTDSDGCVGNTTVAVGVGEQPTASFTAITPNPCTPDQIQFTSTSTGAATYAWRFGDGSTSTLPNPLYSYTTPGAYHVTLVVTSATGCIDSSSLSETIGPVDYVFIPSAFTPGAETNSTFYPNVLCADYSNLEFRVYDRWGNMVYETTKANQGWDGSYNGKPQPLDVYVYYLKMNCGTCSVFKKGTVTLVR